MSDAYRISQLQRDSSFSFIVALRFSHRKYSFTGFRSLYACRSVHFLTCTCPRIHQMYKYVQLFFGTCRYMRTSTVDTLIVVVVVVEVVVVIVIVRVIVLLLLVVVVAIVVVVVEEGKRGVKCTSDRTLNLLERVR